MNRDHVSAAVFDQAGHFDCVDRGIIPPGSNLHRERDRHGLANAAQNLLELRQIAKQRRAASAVDDFLGGASAVDVYDVGAALFDDLGGVDHSFVIVAEYLNRKRALLGQELHHPDESACCRE